MNKIGLTVQIKSLFNINLSYRGKIGTVIKAQGQWITLRMDGYKIGDMEPLFNENSLEYIDYARIVLVLI